MKVDFFRHNIDEDDIQRVVDVLRAGLSTADDTMHEFESRFAEFLGIPHIIGMSSCTEALQLTLLAFGVGPADEVITTPMTFCATSNAILHVGARPIFVDVEPTTGNIDPDRIESAITRRTKAILPVHLYGQMCDMKRIRGIADNHHLVVIEDAAHCLEGEREGIKPGGLGDAACFSFYATKNITCGEGGAVATASQEHASILRHLIQHRVDQSGIDAAQGLGLPPDAIPGGWYSGMNVIQAALLIGQLDRILTLWRRREQIAQMYRESFEKVDAMWLLADGYNIRHARHLFTIHVPADVRSDFLASLQERGVGVSVNYQPVHLYEFYRRKFGYNPGDFPVAEKIGSETITLPLYPLMTDDEVAYVIESVKAEVVRLLD
ncbi:MAG: DegT/DnrJ/EryC1/StrS family aminotransferase [Thermodesulfobacteriota bacterium]